MPHHAFDSRIVRRLTKLVGARTAILMYHRVVEPCIDPWKMCVTPSHFEEQLDVLSRKWNVLSLREIVEHLKKGQIPHRSVVVTFDDGYVCNLLTGKPMLEKYGLPATRDMIYPQ